MIYILYSADYELYLGGVSLPEEAVLIQPTQQLLATCDRLGIPLTLFADMACLWRYRELGQERFPALAEAQLVDAAKRHHDVQTHLHPHWAYTHFQDGAFVFPPKKYLLGTLDPDPQERFRLTCHWLQRASDELTRLIRPHVPDYRCLAFRAGGYGLQPEERMILKALRQTGYRIDSSIIPNARFVTNVQQVDFTQLPKQPNYWLNETHGLTTPVAPGDGLFEIPIAASTLNWRDRLIIHGPEAIRQFWLTLWGRSVAMPTRGYPCNLSEAVVPSSRLKHAYWRAQARMATRFVRLELGSDPRALLTCLQRYLDALPEVGEEMPIFLSLNCHPKGLHQAQLDGLTQFHVALKRRYRTGVQAITFQQAWEKISGA